MHFLSLDRMAKNVRVPNQKKVVLLFHFLWKISHNLCFCEQKKKLGRKERRKKKEKLENEKISFVTSNSCVLLLDSIQKNNFSFTIHIFFLSCGRSMRVYRTHNLLHIDFFSLCNSDSDSNMAYKCSLIFHFSFLISLYVLVFVLSFDCYSIDDLSEGKKLYEFQCLGNTR